MQSTGCPNRQRLSAYLSGTLSGEEAKRIADHLENCVGCKTLVEVLEGFSGAAEAGGRKASSGAEAATLDSHPQDAGLPAMSTAGTAALGQLGDYRLLEKLGRGGMGTVYKALHLRLGRVVALKVLPKQRIADEHAVARFQREMMAVGALDHPNIVRATDASEAQGTHFLVMELVDGLDLSEVVRRCGPLPVADACELIRQAALGLGCADQHGLVHRDIKPSNVMLTVEGQAKVLDLGLARFQFDQPAGDEMTAAGQAMGTADYIAPEQVSDSHSVDIRADIYSLGCTFYRLLAGRPPFGGPQYQGVFEKMSAHVREPVPPIRQSRSDVPRRLAEVIDRMLAKDPADRYLSPAEVAEALGPFCAGCDLRRLLAEARQAEGQATGGQAALAATSEYRSSAMAGTRPSETGHPPPPAVPRRRRFWPWAVAAGSMLLALGAVWLFTVVLRIDNDGQETVVRVPDGSEVDVHPDGRVDVKLPRRGDTGKSSSTRAHAKQVIADDAKRTPDPLIRPREPATEETAVEPAPPTVVAHRGDPQEDPPVQPGQPPVAELPDRSTAQNIQREPLELIPGAPLGRIALVAEPMAIQGVRSWTIETRAHRGAVYDAVFRPDGRLIATGSSDGAIRLWNWPPRPKAQTGSAAAGGGQDDKRSPKKTPDDGLVRILLGHDGRVNSLAFSPDGSAIASGGSDRTIRLWDASTGLLLRTLRGHLAEVYSVDFSADGRRLASAGSDKSVRLWDVVSGKTLAALRGHTGEVYSVAFSPDGKLLASGAGDLSVRLWSVPSGQLLHRLQDNKGPVSDVAFSPDGKVVAAAVAAGQLVSSVMLWDPATGKAAGTLTGHRYGDNCLAFSPDGQLLAVGAAQHDKNVRLWNFAAGDLLHSLTKPSGTGATWCVGFSPDGQTLAAGGSRGRVQFWQSISGRPGHTLPAHAAAARSVAFSPDETTITCGYADGTVRLWQTATGAPVRQLSPDVEAVKAVAYSPDGKTLATGYSDSNLVDLWEVATGERRSQLRAVKGPVEEIAFAPDGKTLALGGEQAQLWDAVSGDPLRNLPGHGSGMAFSPDGAALAVAAGGDVRLLEPQSGKLRRTLYSARARLTTMAFSPDGKTLAAGSEDRKVYLWDAESGRLLHTLTDHRAPVVSLTWLEDGATLVSGDWNEVHVWQPNSGKLLRSIEVDGGAVSANGRLIAARGPSTLRLYQLDDGKLIRTIVALSGQSHLALTPSGRSSSPPESAGQIVYVVQTDTGQETLTPGEFAGQYRVRSGGQ